MQPVYMRQSQNGLKDAGRHAWLLPKFEAELLHLWCVKEMLQVFADRWQNFS